MFPLIPAIAPMVGMGGTLANMLTSGKQVGSARDAGANPYGDARTQYEGTYSDMYNRTRGDTRDAAILQGLANTGGGSAGSGASAVSQMGQRAGAVQANANMAANDAARGYAGGVQQQMLANARAYDTYADQQGTGNANLFGAFAQIPSAIGGMIGGIDEEIKGNKARNDAAFEAKFGVPPDPGQRTYSTLTGPKQRNHGYSEGSY